MLPQHLLLGQLLQPFLHLKKCLNQQCKKAFLFLLLSHVTLMPSKLLMEFLDYILTSLTYVFNSSLASGIFPQCYNSALVTPILKMRCLDHNDLDNYQTVSNLCFIAKILEKLVISQVSSCLNTQYLQYLSISISSRSQH